MSLLLLLVKKTKPKANQKRVFDYSKINTNELIAFLNNIDYNTRVFSLPIIDQADVYSDILSDAFTRFVPSKLVTIRQCDQLWLNKFTCLLIHLDEPL